MNNLDNTGKLERRSSLADHASILKGQTAVDAAQAIEEDISRRFGVFIEEHVSGIVQAAINKTTADLRAQLATVNRKLEVAMGALERIINPTASTYGNPQFIAAAAIKTITEMGD